MTTKSKNGRRKKVNTYSMRSRLLRTAGTSADEEKNRLRLYAVVGRVAQWDGVIENIFIAKEDEISNPSDKASWGKPECVEYDLDGLKDHLIGQLKIQQWKEVCPNDTLDVSEETREIKFKSERWNLLYDSDDNFAEAVDIWYLEVFQTWAEAAVIDYINNEIQESINNSTADDLCEWGTFECNEVADSVDWWESWWGESSEKSAVDEMNNFLDTLTELPLSEIIEALEG